MNDTTAHPIDGSSENDWTTELTTSDVHSVLSSERRRVLLGVLQTQSFPMDLDSLTEAVATQQSETGESAPDSLDTIAVSLHHNHLPLLSSLDLIAYDWSEQQVEKSGR